MCWIQDPINRQMAQRLLRKKVNTVNMQSKRKYDELKIHKKAMIYSENYI